MPVLLMHVRWSEVSCGAACKTQVPVHGLNLLSIHHMLGCIYSICHSCVADQLCEIAPAVKSSWRSVDPYRAPDDLKVGHPITRHAVLGGMTVSMFSAR